MIMAAGHVDGITRMQFPVFHLTRLIQKIVFNGQDQWLFWIVCIVIWVEMVYSLTTKQMMIISVSGQESRNHLKQKMWCSNLMINQFDKTIQRLAQEALPPLL